MRYPCPCCGYLVFEEQGSWGMCRVCGWQDNIYQLRWPDSTSGVNLTLIESQLEYARGKQDGRGDDDFFYQREAGWRPIDPEQDDFEPKGVREANWPVDLTVLYYWRPTFWRR